MNMLLFTRNSSLILLLLMTFLSIDCNANGYYTLPDSVSKTDYKLKKAEFLERYGTDDSLQILINDFYTYRKLGTLMVLTLPLASLTFTADVLYYHFIQSKYGFGPFIPIFTLVSGMFPNAIIFAPIGCLVLLNHSRKELYGIVADYNAGKSFPPKHKKKIKRKLDNKKMKDKFFGN